jgi:hypothetical protein
VPQRFPSDHRERASIHGKAGNRRLSSLTFRPRRSNVRDVKTERREHLEIEAIELLTWLPLKQSDPDGIGLVVDKGKLIPELARHVLSQTRPC